MAAKRKAQKKTAPSKNVRAAEIFLKSAEMNLRENFEDCARAARSLKQADKVVWQASNEKFSLYKRYERLNRLYDETCR